MKLEVWNRAGLPRLWGGRKYTRTRAKFQGDAARARECISPPPQSPSPPDYGSRHRQSFNDYLQSTLPLNKACYAG